MCGIAGIVQSRPDGAQVVARMLRQMEHRGPDDSGIVTFDDSGTHVCLGHRRLSIIDLSADAHQPMPDRDGMLVLTYNGEIYNYVELRAELASLGVTFKSQSDTEVILEAYRLWGAKCLDRFNGMFAFALYDRRRQVLFCARDRYGEKPFLYAAKPGFFAFASEYKALLQLPEVGRDYDEVRLIRAAYNPSRGLDGDRQTVFDDIAQLLPSECLELDVRTGACRVWRYWSMAPKPLRETADERAVFDEFRTLLTDSVRIRMRSDVPSGSCLSGGLDSSAIVCLTRGLIGKDAPYHTFTGRFPGTYADEWTYAHDVVAAANVTSHVVEPTAERLMDELPAFVWHNELPVSSTSQYAQWCVFRLARENGITVLLDGQGADELLGGYEQYFAAYVDSLRERGELDRLNRELPAIRSRYPLALPSEARSLRDRLPLCVRHWLSNRLGFGTNLLYGLRPNVARAVDAMNEREPDHRVNPLTDALRSDSFGHFLTTLLRYGDRNSMAHSREVRLPFCDHRLAEFVFTLPPHLLMGGAQTKRLLRESLTGVLPESIRTRWNKQGFRPPQDLWFTAKPMLELVRDTFASANFANSGYWTPAWWRAAVDRLEKGEHALAWVIWQPFMIEMWRTHFAARLGAPRAG
jgi:asparagine synthase (glutamine-hydrolysing)